MYGIFICSLFNDALSNYDFSRRMKELQVNHELERMRRKRSWPNLRYYHGICLEELRKTKKNLSG
jgi:hypothetical protein